MANLATYSRVIYASRWVDSATGDLSDAMADILASSMRNNAFAGLTGLLLYRRGWFLQVLEGDLDAVDRTFDRIRRDPRHFDIRIVADDPIFERAFADWSMCARHLDDVPRSVLAGLGLGPSFDTARLDPDNALALLFAAGEAGREQEQAA